MRRPTRPCPVSPPLTRRPLARARRPPTGASLAALDVHEGQPAGRGEREGQPAEPAEQTTGHGEQHQQRHAGYGGPTHRDGNGIHQRGRPGDHGRGHQDQSGPGGDRQRQHRDVGEPLAAACAGRARCRAQAVHRGPASTRRTPGRGSRARTTVVRVAAAARGVGAPGTACPASGPTRRRRGRATTSRVREDRYQRGGAQRRGERRRQGEPQLLHGNAQAPARRRSGHPGGGDAGVPPHRGQRSCRARPAGPASPAAVAARPVSGGPARPEAVRGAPGPGGGRDPGRRVDRTAMHVPARPAAARVAPRRRRRAAPSTATRTPVDAGPQARRRRCSVRLATAPTTARASSSTPR